jgi:HAD superfamily hydrolase (TIGR01490 family)
MLRDVDDVVDAPGTDLARPGAADHPPSKVAAFFDLDKTIIAGSSTLAFSGPMRARGMISRQALLRSGYAQLMLMRSGADAEFMDRMREQISALCTGWDAAEVRALIEEFLPTILMPMIYAEAAELIEEHRARDHHVAVVSASGEEMVAPIAAALGAEHSVATRMVVADGRYTGEIGFYCYGEGKATAARRLADEHGYRLEDSFAYSDSITDLPLLEVVGHPHAVNPDRALREVAEQRGWPVLEFAAPVPLPARVVARLRGLLPAEPRLRGLLPAEPRLRGLLPAEPRLRGLLPAGPNPRRGTRTAAWSLGGVAAAVALSMAWRGLRRAPAALTQLAPAATLTSPISN